MGTYDDPRSLAAAQEQRFRRLQQARTAAFAKLTDGGLADAKSLTSGKLSPSETKEAFARSPKFGGGFGSAPLLPINAVTGALNRAFRLVRGSKQTDLTQQDPGGGIFRIVPGGTRSLKDSGFFERLKSLYRDRVRKALESYKRASRD